MTSRNKAKGTRWETAVLRHLQATADPAARRPRPEGNQDVGDIHACGATWQTKDWASWTDAIREGLDGAVRQANASGLRPPIAVVKRARKPVGEAYAVLRLTDLTDLLAERARLREETASAD